MYYFLKYEEYHLNYIVFYCKKFDTFLEKRSNNFIIHISATK